MHSPVDGLETAIESDEFESREAEWGDMHVAVQTFHAEMDTTPLLTGLPDDRCQCPHWGYSSECNYSLVRPHGVVRSSE